MIADVQKDLYGRSIGRETEVDAYLLKAPFCRVAEMVAKT